MINNAHQLCSAVSAQGTRYIFTVPGTPSIPLFHSFFQAEFKIINATSELNAAFMANGYSRASGAPGVIAVIGGPGLLEAIPGIAEAQADSVPMVVIVCHPGSKNGPRFRLHNFDHHAILRPVAKCILEIKSSGEIGSTISQAYTEATSGEPGPVCVLVCPELLSGQALHSAQPKIFPQAQSQLLDPANLDLLVERIQAANRPTIIAGAGCLECSTDLVRLAETLGTPVITTLSARGIIPENHALNFYQDSSVGSATVVNELFESSDLIIALGCKFSHNGCAGFTFHLPSQKLIHIDASEDVLNAHYSASLAICADIPTLVGNLAQRPLHSSPGWAPSQLEEFKKRIREEEQKQIAYPPLISEQPCQNFFDALRSAMAATDRLVTDTGLHQSLTRIFYRVLSPRGLIAPSDFQCMGYGLPAAIGARLGTEQGRLAAIIGDGAFLCSCMEITSAVTAGLQLPIFVFSDGHYGVIRLEQLRANGSDIGVDVPKLDFAAFAKSVGANYFKLERPTTESISGILAANGVSIVEVPVTDNPGLDKFINKAQRRAALRRVINPALYAGIKRIFGR